MIQSIINLREKVYAKLKGVPKGKVTTYKDLAQATGTKAYRAIGSFMKINHNPREIPCYKVIKSDGSIGEYSAPRGVGKKISLLKQEGIKVKKRQNKSKGI